MNQKINNIECINLANNKYICLTLDLERDYGDLFDKSDYDGISQVHNLVSFLEGKDVPITVFVQGSIFEKFPNAIKQLSMLDAEFELHSYSHAKYKNTSTQYEVETGRKAYYEYFAKDPIGYRFPSGQFNSRDYAILAANGFKFDSSIFPSIRPGYFNNLRMPIAPYYLEKYNIVELPITVFSKFVRIPVSLSYFKLVGWPCLELLRSPLRPHFIIFNFHMHDLFILPAASKINKETTSIQNRIILKKIYQEKSINGFEILKKVISILQEHQYEFVKLNTIYGLVTKGQVL